MTTTNLLEEVLVRAREEKDVQRAIDRPEGGIMSIMSTLLGALIVVLVLAVPVQAAELRYDMFFGLTNSTALEMTVPLSARKVLRLQYVSGRYGDGNPRDALIGWSQTMRLQGDLGWQVTPRTVLYAGYTSLSHRAEDTGVTWRLVGPVVGLRGTAPLSSAWSVAYDFALRPWNQFIHDDPKAWAKAFGTEARLGVQYRPSAAIDVELGWWQWWWDTGRTDAIWSGPYGGVTLQWR